jgi:hypothetical protein
VIKGFYEIVLKKITSFIIFVTSNPILIILLIATYFFLSSFFYLILLYRIFLEAAFIFDFLQKETLDFIIKTLTTVTDKFREKKFDFNSGGDDKLKIIIENMHIL